MNQEAASLLTIAFTAYYTCILYLVLGIMRTMMTAVSLHHIITLISESSDNNFLLLYNTTTTIATALNEIQRTNNKKQLFCKE